MNATPEEWRPVTGHQGYEVSNLGRIRSIDRTIVTKRGVAKRRKGQLLRPFKGDRLNHQVVSFGHRDRHYVHTVVLEAFVGLRPEHCEACHNDGDPLNNCVDNLRWDSPSANQRDRRKHGTHHYASRTQCKWGHEYTPKNTGWRIRTGPRYVKPSRIRVCLTCVKNRNRNRSAA